MYPPERRAHGIALVLFGAVFGAMLGPFVFSPLLAGRELDGDALAGLWAAAGGFMLAGLVLVLAVRPDPMRSARPTTRRASRRSTGSARARPVQPGGVLAAGEGVEHQHGIGAVVVQRAVGLVGEGDLVEHPPPARRNGQRSAEGEEPGGDLADAGARIGVWQPPGRVAAR